MNNDKDYTLCLKIIIVILLFISINGMYMVMSFRQLLKYEKEGMEVAKKMENDILARDNDIAKLYNQTLEKIGENENDHD